MLYQLEAQLKVGSFKPITNQVIAWSVPDENAQVCEFLEFKYRHYDELETGLLINSVNQIKDARWAAILGPIPDSQIDCILERFGNVSLVRFGPVMLLATWLGPTGHAAMRLIGIWVARDSRSLDTYALLVSSEPLPNVLLESRSFTALNPLPEVIPEPPRLVTPPAKIPSPGVRFRINNRTIGARVLVGPQPSIPFFDNLKGQLQGKCTVKFRIGDQVVENEVILNGSELQVNTTFKAIDIMPFIESQKQRVRREMEEAHFEEHPTDMYFLPASTLIAQERVFPDFNKDKLAKDPTGPKYFVSHRWLNPKHPDPNGTHLKLLQKHASKHTDAFYWIDYSCLPQSRERDDENLFSRTLPKIASIQAKASTIVILASDYDERLWCYVEHITAVFFAQTNVATVGKRPRMIEYLGPARPDDNIIERAQMLQEPDWDRLKVTKPSDIPGVKYNYRWLTNLVKFQLYDRFSELRESLPGNEWYSGLHYPQSAFGINHSDSLAVIRSLFKEFGGDADQLFTENSLLWLAERLSWSASPDNYRMEAMCFSPSLLFSEDMVGWFALLLGIIKVLNQGNDKIVNLRELYAKMVLMSLFK